MKSEEQLTLDIIVKVCTGLVRRREAQQLLNVSERTLRRYVSGYQKWGAVFVKHGNSNKMPINKAEKNLKQTVQTLVKDTYFDLNMSHCLEKLEKEHNIWIKRETFRKWVHEIDMVKRSKRRRSKVRKYRQRMEQTGLMLQMDGSPEYWFGGKLSCLIAAIDDADSEVPFGEFFPSEDTISCMRVLQKIIEKKGLFHILYTDKAGIFGGPKRMQFSQVKRALKELGIHIIFANSGEAKGRVERLWDTLQDRLIPEMRLKKIKSYEAANRYLQEQYLPNEHNPKFKVTPANLQTAYRPLPKGIDLNEIFCLKEHRTVARDHTVSYQNETYLIDSDLKHSIWKQKIELRTYQDLTWKAFFAGRPIKITKVQKAKKAAATLKDMLPEVGNVCTEKVRKDEHVLYGKQYYSVDRKYVGQKVSLHEKHDHIFIYHKGKLIEKRPKIKDRYQRCSTKPEHLTAWEEAMAKTSVYRKAALNQGPHVDKLVLTILKQGHGFVDNRSIWGIINCEKIYPYLAIDQACKHALELENPSLKAVKLFLQLLPSHHKIKTAAVR